MPVVLFNDIKAQNSQANTVNKASFYISLGLSLISLFPEIFKRGVNNAKKRS